MNDLIERYIYAATRRMDRKQREDVAQELRGLIDDMLAERCGSLTPTEKDIRIVLTELGTPQEVYERYDEDPHKCLIGQPYYAAYKVVLLTVLGAVAVGMTVSALILQMLERQGFLAMTSSWLALLWEGLLDCFAIVTLLFAFFSRKGVKLTNGFSFDDLPPVPKKSEVIPKWESIAGIGFCVVFLVLFLFTPEVFSVIRDRQLISLFDLQAIRASWPLILGFAACGIIRELVQLLEGRYNKKVMITALVTDLLSALLAVWWLVGYDVLNQEFLNNMESIFAGEDRIVFAMFGSFDLFFLGVLLFALVLDVVDVTVKTLRK